MDNIQWSFVYNHSNKFNILQYLKLRGSILKLVQYDDTKDCFGDYTPFEIVSKMASNFDLYMFRKGVVSIGGVILGPPHKDKKVFSIAYILDSPYRGQGIGTHIFKMAVKTCFEYYDCDKIRVSSNVDNYVSKRIIENCNFSIKQDGGHLGLSRFGEYVREVTYNLDRDTYYDNISNFSDIEGFVSGKQKRLLHK